MRTIRTLAAVALAAGLAAPAAASGPAAAASTRTTAPAAAAEPALPAPGSRADGWTAAVRRGTPVDSLVLVSPEGAERVVGPTAGGAEQDEQVLDVAPDARHVITGRWGAAGLRATIWDVAAGSSRALTLPERAGLSAAPQGYLLTQADGTIRLLSWDGRLLRTFSAVADTWPWVVAEPSGRWFLERRSRQVLVRDLRTGAVTNRVRFPAGTTCEVQGGWDAVSGSMSCEHPAQHDHRVYRVGYTSAVRSVPLSPVGWERAWPGTPRVVSGWSSWTDTGTWAPGQEDVTHLPYRTLVTGVAGGRIHMLDWHDTPDGGPLSAGDLTGRRLWTLAGTYGSARTVDRVG